MLQAMNTGHEGSMTTVHANTPRDALSRVETMVGMGGIQMSETLIRQTIARSLNVIVQLARGTDGKRRITSVAEITDIQAGVITMQEIFKFEQQGVDAAGKIVGDFRFTGIRPARPRSHRALRHQPGRDHQAVPVRMTAMKIILIGVVAFTAVALLEALVYTLRFLERPQKRRAQTPAVRLGTGTGGPAAVGRAAHGEAGGQPCHRRAAALDQALGAAGEPARADRAGVDRRAAARVHAWAAALLGFVLGLLTARAAIMLRDPAAAVRPAAALLRDVQARPAHRAAVRAAPGRARDDGPLAARRARAVELVQDGRDRDADAGHDRVRARVRGAGAGHAVREGRRAT